MKTPNKKMTNRQEELVKKHAHSEYDSSVIDYPTGLCSGCRANLYHCEKPGGLEGRSDPKIKWNAFQLHKLHTSRKHDPETCCICKTVKQTPIGQKGDQSIRPKILPRGESEPPLPNKLSPKKICIKGNQMTGPGIPHPCTTNSAKATLLI